MLGNCIENVRKNVPLVHNITNYVTVNDVANILLACGGSPIMSDEPQDVEDITSICGGLNINILFLCFLTAERTELRLLVQSSPKRILQQLQKDLRYV